MGSTKKNKNGEHILHYGSRLLPTFKHMIAINIYRVSMEL